MGGTGAVPALRRGRSRTMPDVATENFSGTSQFSQRGVVHQQGRHALELFTLSFAALFLELMVIRWAPSVVRLVAYYGNLMLISSFLGLGIGAMIAGRGKRLLNFFGALVAAEVVLLLLCQHALLPGSHAEARFYAGVPAQQVWNYLMLIGLFVFNA